MDSRMRLQDRTAVITGAASGIGRAIAVAKFPAEVESAHPRVDLLVIVRGVGERKPRVLVGKDAIALSIVERIAPVSYRKLLGRALGDYEVKST
jgi:hypothetical protein